MILMYHKVDIITPSRWWVTVEQFQKQIDALKEGFEFVYLDDYDPEQRSQVVLTFDDAYESVCNHAFPILKKSKLPFEVFVIGDLLGRWNEFDQGEIMTRFCSMEQLEAITGGGGRIQWHTKSHPRLTLVDDAEIERQLEINDELKNAFDAPHFRWFSYPYGLHDERVVQAVQTKLSGAVSVVDGSNHNQFELNREVVDVDWWPDLIQ